MPEIIEVEYYRRLAARAVGRRIVGVDAPDDWWLKTGLTAEELVATLSGSSFTAARRRGKLLVLDTADGDALGIRFGMTGRLLVDGQAALEHLEYGSAREEPAWDRLVIHLGDGGDLRVRDPRRLGGAELGPDLTRLGPDAYEVTVGEVRRALGDSPAPLKARLLDQSRVAGIGNLLADETLWRAGLDPARPAGSLSGAEHRRLHRHLHRVLDDLTERGGSHTGTLQGERHRDGRCPRDGTRLERRTVGGRTTYFCPAHQR